MLTAISNLVNSRTFFSSSPQRDAFFQKRHKCCRLAVKQVPASEPFKRPVPWLIPLCNLYGEAVLAIGPLVCCHLKGVWIKSGTEKNWDPSGFITLALLNRLSLDAWIIVIIIIIIIIISSSSSSSSGSSDNSRSNSIVVNSIITFIIKCISFLTFKNF